MGICKLALNPCAGGGDAQIVAAQIGVQSGHGDPFASLKRAITAIEQIVECIETFAEIPTLVGHEEIVQFPVETGNCAETAAVNYKYRHVDGFLSGRRQVWQHSGENIDPECEARL